MNLGWASFGVLTLQLGAIVFYGGRVAERVAALVKVVDALAERVNRLEDITLMHRNEPTK